MLPERWFYGWYIAIACALLMFVGVGVGYYGLPIFLQPLRDAHGWSTTQVSWAPTIYFCVSGLTSAIVGPYVDRKGPTTLMVVGTLINGVSAAFIGLVDELWQLYVVYFVFAVAFGMSSSIAVNAIMTRWFVRKRALAMSISSTGVSLGGVVLAPVASKLIDVGGLELATPVLGALVIIVALPVIFAVIVLSGLLHASPVFYAGVVLLGLGTGFATVSNLSLMLDMTTAEKVGMYIGAWGVANAISRLVGQVLGGVVRDVVTLTVENPVTGYVVVFSLEAVCLLVALALLSRIDVGAFQDAAKRPVSLAESAALMQEAQGG